MVPGAELRSLTNWLTGLLGMTPPPTLWAWAVTQPAVSLAR